MIGRLHFLPYLKPLLMCQAYIALSFHGVSLMFGPYFGSKPPPLPTELSRARHRPTPRKPVNSPQPSSNGEAACVDTHLHWTSFQTLIRLDSRPNPSARVSWVRYFALHLSLLSPKLVSGHAFTRAPVIFIHVGTGFQVASRLVCCSHQGVLSRLVKLEVSAAENPTILLHLLPCMWWKSSIGTT